MDEKKMQKRVLCQHYRIVYCFITIIQSELKKSTMITQNDLDFCGRITSSILVTEWWEIASQGGGCIGLDNHSRIGNDWQIVKMIFDAL